MKIKLIENGPLVIDVESEISVELAGNSESQKGPLFLCRCGLSANKPFCDASHRKGKFEGAAGVLDVP